MRGSLPQIPCPSEQPLRGWWDRWYPYDMADKFSEALRESPLFLTTRAALALTARCRHALRAHGIDDINPAQLSILTALEAHDGATPTEIARVVMYEKSTLTPLLDKLEEAGLLVRARDPKDGRSQRLYVTKKGKKRRREAETVLSALTDDITAALPRKVLRHHVEFCEAVLASDDDGHPRKLPARATAT